MQSHVTQRYMSAFNCYVNNCLRLLLTEEEYTEDRKATMKELRRRLKAGQDIRDDFLHSVYLPEKAKMEAVSLIVFRC